MTASNGTVTLAEARAWLLSHDLPEGVTVSPRGRLSSAAKLHFSKKTRKLISDEPAVQPTGIKSKLAAYVENGGTLPEGVTVTPGRGRLSKAAHDFAASL